MEVWLAYGEDGLRVELPDDRTTVVQPVHAQAAAGGAPIVLRADAVSPAAPGADGKLDDVPVVQADVHDEAVHGPAAAWEDLSPKQKAAWKDRLREAGHWAEGMGDSVFKGILFGELAGAVGRAVAG